MEYALIGGVVLFVIVVVLLVYPNDPYTRWQDGLDPIPDDLRRAHDDAERKNQPPNMTWMWD